MDQDYLDSFETQNQQLKKYLNDSVVKEYLTYSHGADPSKLSEPMPWIGLYIAAASMICGLAMAADLIRGFRNRKLWFPSRFFSINAASLTIVTVAVKLSVDLNTEMPRWVDQRAKLSSSVLICTVMANSMPSLGTMDDKDLIMNVVALGILVVTVIVNVGIQLGTGLISPFFIEHVFLMFIMFVLLLIICFSALTVPSTKKYLEYQYKKNEMALEKGLNETDKLADKKLKEDLMKFWVMAHTCSPQFVVGRSATCIASGALCLLSAMIFAEAMLRSYFLYWRFGCQLSVWYLKYFWYFDYKISDYDWSSILIFSVQTVAIGVGTIGPAIRWFAAVNFRRPTITKGSCTRFFKVEKYWTQSLMEMKEHPLTVQIPVRFCRKLSYDARNKLLDMCIGLQIGIVLSSKAIQWISVYFVSNILLFCAFCRKLKFRSNSTSKESGSESQDSPALDLSPFVLHLEGEDEIVELMMKNNRDATNQCMCKGKKKQPKHLIELVKKATSSEGFKGVKDFDSELVASLDSEESPNCWALPIVTLTAIAIALPNVSASSKKQLISSVHEGFVYVKLIEDNLDARRDSFNIRKAAHAVWLGVDLYQRWFDIDLHELSTLAERSEKEVLEGLADVATKKFEEFKARTDHWLMESPLNWPIKALAANSMYRISKTILQKYESKDDQMDRSLFEDLVVIISDVMCACLTNLKRVIFRRCLNNTIEEREDCVRRSVFLLGETEEILKLLDDKAPHGLNADQMARIDEWRSLTKLNDDQASHSSCDKMSSGFCPSVDLPLDMV